MVKVGVCSNMKRHAITDVSKCQQIEMRISQQLLDGYFPFLYQMKAVNL